LLPEPVEGRGHLVGFWAQALEQPVSVERQKDGVRDAVDVGHVAVLGSRRGQDDHVAWRRPARQQHLARAVRDRLLDLAGGHEDHHVAPLSVKSQRVPGRQGDGAHTSGDGPNHAVAELCEHRRHLEDARPQLEGGRRLVGGGFAASTHLAWLLLLGPLGFLNLTGGQNADNVPTSPRIDRPSQ